MQPIILSNAFLRPRAVRTASGVRLSKEAEVYACGEEIVAVIRNALGASPLLLPTTFDKESVRDLLAHIDGIFLPGALSNVHPSLYGEEPDETPQTFDSQHDETDLFLVRQAYALGIPFFGICRAMQAMNVAFGGSLRQHLDKNGGVDHVCSDPCLGEMDRDDPQYMHEVVLEKGGILKRLFEDETFSVNSLHGQAVNRLGTGLRIEARASDGVIEAVSLEEAETFFVGVQWHPEYLPTNVVSKRLFEAFRADVEERFMSRTQSL